MMTDSPSTII